MSQPNLPPEPIAIVGVAAKLSGKATSASALWDLVLAGETTVSAVPPSRFNVGAFVSDGSDSANELAGKYGNFLAEDISRFDANFFAIPAQEANAMDPQQRILLETAYHALENAGIPMESAAGSRTGVFVGASSKDYEAILLRDPDYMAKYHMMGIGTAMLSNRISHFFDLRGPSLTLDTGCSSSLVALHQACNALRAGECDAALVGGCHLVISPDAGSLPLSKLGFLSPDGRCWGFDEKANGFGRSEGMAFFVIKRLTTAQKDKDTIRAIVRATSVNQDGHTPGVTMPSAEMQYHNILAAYDSVGLDLSETQYFEAHGTGTQVGDAIEASAIHKAFKRSCSDPLFIGSVKKNIGHMEPGSGLAGMMKAMFMLENGLVPREIDSGTLNPKIPFAELGIKLSCETISWSTSGVRRLSLNSFGYGGTNAHVIMEDATQHSKAALLAAVEADKSEKRCTESKDDASIIILSASDEGGITRAVESLQTHLHSIARTNTKASATLFRRLVYTLNERRSRLPWKSAVNASSFTDLMDALFTRLTKPVRSSIRPTLSFVFSGQGGNYPGMGVDLLQLDVFRQSIEACDQAIHDFGSPWSIVDELSKLPGDSRVHVPLLSQPLASALQIALVDLLRSWHIYPETVVGHSSGEIAAAYQMGAISRRSAIKIAYFRGIVAGELERITPVPMTMSSVGLSQEDIRPYIRQIELQHGPNSVDVGCINSNASVTLSGSKAALDTLSRDLEARGIFNRRLAVTVPYHSVHMSAVSDRYRTLLGVIEPGPALPPDATPVTMFSSVTTSTINPEHLRNPEYWVENLVNPVRFLETFQKLILSSDRSTGAPGQILELAPHAVLQRSIKDIVTLCKRQSTFEYESLLFRDVSALKSCLGAIGRLCCRNVPVSMLRVNAALRHDSPACANYLPLSDLPAYPFNHSKSYWHESRISRNYRFRQHRRHELFGNRVIDWNPLQPRWRNFLRPADIPWIAEQMVRREQAIRTRIHISSLRSHLYPAADFEQVDEHSVFPVEALLMLPLECYRQLHNCPGGIELINLRFFEPLKLANIEDQVEIETVFQPLHDSVESQNPHHGYRFLVYAWADDCSTLLCTGHISGRPDTTSDEELHRICDKAEHQGKTCRSKVDRDTFYQRKARQEHMAGSTSRPTLSHIRTNGKGVAIATLHSNTQPADSANGSRATTYFVQPATLGALFHLGKAGIDAGSLSRISRLYPTALAKLSLASTLRRNQQADTISAMASVVEKGARTVRTNTIAFDAQRQVLISIEGLEETTNSEPLVQTDPQDLVLHCTSYSWKPDITQLNPEQLAQYALRETAHLPRPSTEWYDEYETIAQYAIANALEKLDPASVEKLPGFLQRYWAWMKWVFDPNAYHDMLNRHPRLRDAQQRALYLEEFGKRGASEEILVETVKAIVPVLNGEITGLDFLFTSGLANRFYASTLQTLAARRLASIIDLMAHKNPELKLIEIGAGTGAVTGHIIETLSTTEAGDNFARYTEYCYTDISPSFFEDARERFVVEVNKQRMQFRALDIERPPANQQRSIESYDVVIAFSVLHATSDIRSTLRHVRSLLKEGGRLFLYEPIAKETARVGITFGLVKGWWLGIEPERQLSPLLSPDEWHQALLETGFTGLECCIHDTPDDDQGWHAILSSTAAPHTTHTAGVVEEHALPTIEVVFIVDDSSPSQQELAKALISADLPSCGDLRMRSISISAFQKAQPLNAMLIFLLEIEQPLLHNISRDSFETVQRALLSGQDRVIWVTRGGDASDSPSSTAQVNMSVFTGLGRVLNTEKHGCSFVELALQPAPMEETVAAIHQWIKHAKDSNAVVELEISQREGVYHIPRVVPNLALTRHLHDRILQPARQGDVSSDVSNIDRAMTLGNEVPRDAKSASLPGYGDGDGELADTDVELQIKAIGLDGSDLKTATPDEPVGSLCQEFSGIVTRAGQASGFCPGDRVICYSPRTHPDPLVTGAFLTRDGSAALARTPPWLSDRCAATLPRALGSAYIALVQLARLQPTDRVLIHSGTSVTGLVAIFIAKALTATVYATVRNDAEREWLWKQAGLSESLVWQPSDHLSKRVLAEHMDVILDINDEARRYSSWEKLAAGGKFIHVGRGQSSAKHEIQKHCDAVFAAYATVDFSKGQTTVNERIMAKALQLISDFPQMAGIEDHIDVFPPSELERALKALALQQSQISPSFGRVVIDLDIHSDADSRQPQRFSPDATYVIAGGFGGLGRHVIAWMSALGARHFLVPSRSGASTSAAREMVETMSLQGVRVVECRCDIASKESFQRAFDAVQSTLPPIKGCLQMAMSVHDAIFENMSWDQWRQCIRPKVNGTWTLHQVLPKGMDFFIMFASVAGVVGGAGQGNYAAGNTFLDRFAQYRRSLGEHGLSLSVGLISDVGYAAEHDVVSSFVRRGMGGMRLEELLACLDHAIFPGNESYGPDDHVITGLGDFAKMSRAAQDEIRWSNKPLLAVLRRMGGDSAIPSAGTSSQGAVNKPKLSPKELLANALDGTEATQIVVEALVDKLSRVLSVEKANIDPTGPVYATGVDSLVALDIRTWFRKELDVDVHVSQLMSDQSLFSVAERAAKESSFLGSSCK